MTITNDDFEPIKIGSKQDLDVSGEKKSGGGGGRAAQEAKNTLKTVTTARIVELISEGEIEGLVNGGQSIYFDDTPIVNPDNSTNFPKLSYEYRYGLPSQSVLEGYPDIENEFVKGVEIHHDTPVVQQVSSSDVDAVRVTILFPFGLSEQSTTTGDLNGSEVTFKFERQIQGTGVWEIVSTQTIKDKSTSQPELAYRIDRPVASGIWNFRVTRVSPDATSAAVRNSITFARYTEIKDIKNEYPNCAIVGITVDAESTGGKAPVRSYHIKGVKVSIPYNYDPITRQYTGIWNGVFKTAWTDNPAWVLYDLLTNERYGLGEYIKPSDIDKYSFYDAAVYCDELVPDGNGGTEPRFTFNYPLSKQEQALKVLNAVASCMRATVVYSQGLLSVNQDRPSSPVKIVNKSNVIDGAFSYTSTQLQARTTVARVSYNDRNNKWLLDTVVYEDADAIARYGYNPIDVTSYGCTSHGQALRDAKWIVDTNINLTETINYKSSFNQFDLRVGDVIKVIDDDYYGLKSTGRIISATTNSVILDREIQLNSTPLVDVTLPDGTFFTFAPDQESITTNTLTSSTAFAVVPNAQAEFIISGVVQPRLFRVVDIKVDAENIVSISAITYDENKWDRIEQGINQINNPYKPVSFTGVMPVTNIVVTPEFAATDQFITRKLNVRWTKSPTEGVASYTMIWRRDNGIPTVVENIFGDETEINDGAAGVYDIAVYAIHQYGAQSAPTETQYTFTLGGSSSTLNPPTGLIGSTGPTFSTDDLYVSWVNPTTNNGLNGVLKDFVVRVYDNSTNALLRTEIVPRVDAGSTQYYTYTLSNNLEDTGSVPARAVRIDVACRDAANNVSTSATYVCTNPAPAVPNNISCVGITGGFRITFDNPTDRDYAGIIVWGSTTNNFTPGPTNVIYDGYSNNIPVLNIPASTTYYFRIAAYDTFSKSQSGTNLNVSNQYVTTSAASEGIPSGANNPATGTEGDLFFNTTDGQLYRYHSGAWTAAVPAVNITGQLTDSQLASIAAAKLTGQITNTQISDVATSKLTGTVSDAQIAGLAASKVTGQLTDSQLASIAAAKLTGTISGSQIAAAVIDASKIASGLDLVTVVSSVPSTKSTNLIYNSTDYKMYRWNGTSYVATISSTDISGTIAAGQIASLAASQITGQLSDSQLAAISTAKLTGTIVGTQITDGAITAAKIAANTITASNIAADTITASQIAAGAITTTELATGAVTAAKITAGTITSTEIASGTIKTLNLYSGAVEADKIQTANLAAGSITTGILAAGAVTAAKIAVGTITANEIASATITGAKITANTITASNIAANTITASQIAAGAITTTELAAGAVTAAKITAGTITSTEIATGTITAGNLYAGTTQSNLIQANNIASGSITTAKIAAGAITSNEIAANTITAADIAAGTITATEIASGAITTTKLAAGAVTANELAANSVIAGKILASTITADKLSITSLSAITANMGSITSGNITIDSAGYIRGGMTGYLTGSGFWQGYDGGVYKWSVGNSAGNYIAWNGTTLTINGTASAASTVPAAGVQAGNLNSNVVALQVNGGGTFSGALSAASGTFAGSLSAATGTFSGTLTAQAINAVDTINIRGGAVVVPLMVHNAAANIINNVTYNGTQTVVAEQQIASFSTAASGSGNVILFFGGSIGSYTATTKYTQAATFGTQTLKVQLVRRVGAVDTVLEEVINVQAQGQLANGASTTATLASTLYFDTPGAGVSVVYLFKYSCYSTSGIWRVTMGYTEHRCVLLEAKV